MQFRYGTIAAGHPTTAQAGIDMLEAGGNAFDAALAAMLVSFVSEASLTSMGGGGFMNTYTAEGKACLYDFFVQTPQKRKNRSEADFRESYIHFGATKQLQYNGKASVAVPGCPAGLFHVHERLGSLPLHEIIQPAVRLAREGVVITAYQAYSLLILESILLEKPEISTRYTHAGRSLKEGEKMYLPLFADCLEWMVKEGKSLFYTGEIGQRLAKDHEKHGGSVSAEDLASYQVIERKPLQASFLNHTLLTNPPPCAGGSLIAHGLALVEQQGLQRMSPTGGDYIKALADVIQQMDAYRRDHLTSYLDQTW